MRIKEIRWKNYRQYQDKSFSFPKTNQCDLHYFVAENGIGKTTFFNSVNWCLYKEEPYLTDKDRAFSILSKAVKKSMQTGDVETVSVELIVECEDGIIKYIREAVMRKTEEGDVSERDSQFKVVTVFRGEDSHVYSDDEKTEVWVNRFVPSRLSPYYFFDAESLKDYFTSESNEKVKKAVFEISDIDTLKKMQGRLKDIETEYRREVTRNNPKTESINSELESLSDQLDKKKKKIETVSEQLETADRELAECAKVLNSNEDSEELENRRAEYSDKIKEYEDKEADIRLKIRAFAKRYTIILNIYPKMKKLYDKLIDMDSNNELPPKITKEFLLEMKSAHRCLVCDREFDGHALTYIEHLIDSHRTKETLAELNSVKGSLEYLMEEAKSYQEKRDELLAHWDEIKQTLDHYIEEKSKVDAKYDSIPDLDKQRYYASQRVKYEAEKKNKTEELFNLKRDSKDLEAKIDKLKREIAEELKKQTKMEKAELCYNMSSRGREVIDSIIDGIREEVREQISKRTSELFLQLIWKKDTYSKVGLTKDYAISAKDSDGEEGVGSTSGAEGQLLALSFILALQSVSGFDSPLIIDTPVARTSGPLRVNFCKALTEVAKEKQVIMFFTEDEFSGKVKDVIQDCASNRFELSLVDEKYVR